jgi:hypothetical protein
MYFEPLAMGSPFDSRSAKVQNYPSESGDKPLDIFGADSTDQSQARLPIHSLLDDFDEDICVDKDPLFSGITHAFQLRFLLRLDYPSTAGCRVPYQPATAIL